VRAIGLPRRRAAAISALAAAAAADPTLLDPPSGVALGAVVARLAALPGIGAGTAGYIAMRALREPDAFAPGDLGILRAAAGPDGAPPTPAALLARAEAWRPWRAYAAMHLWAAGAAMAEAA
jgi:AraC family transcriptional regulator of adaptative response / DNA-3-methyladenine glycosylase II